jgi:ABC-type antimicrobial peptide transport system permease subunit
VKELLINENFAHFLGFTHPGDALGKLMHWENKDVPIVGVMKDFHTHALRSGIRPLAYSYAGKECRDLIIALQPGGNSDGQWKSAIAEMEKVFKKTYPEEDFKYQFFDESIAGFYRDEQNISGLLKWATGLTVFISCLGLLGLVIYTTNRRTKEIGIRKVLGASVQQIVGILSKDFIKLVCIAFVLMTPVAWWAMHKWIENFAFRTPISWWLFPLSGLAMIVIALITLSIQTIRSAMVNPVESLRSE